MFNGSIYYVLQLHILRFYFVGQKWLYNTDATTVSCLVCTPTCIATNMLLLWSFWLWFRSHLVWIGWFGSNQIWHHTLMKVGLRLSHKRLAVTWLHKKNFWSIIRRFSWVVYLKKSYFESAYNNLFSIRWHVILMHNDFKYLKDHCRDMIFTGLFKARC